MNKITIFIVLLNTLFGVYLMSKPNCYGISQTFYKSCDGVNKLYHDKDKWCVNGHKPVNFLDQFDTRVVRNTRGKSVEVCIRLVTCCTPPIGEYLFSLGEYLFSLYQSCKIHYMNGTMWDYFPNIFL